MGIYFLLSAIICGYIASTKNRHILPWFILGYLCGIVILFLLLLLPKSSYKVFDI